MPVATSTVSQPGRRPRLAVLDGLRILAALAVCSYHYVTSWRLDGHHTNMRYFPHVVLYASSYGLLGVEFFFLISGFVIAMSGWGARVGEFFASRVGRLYPAYWACVLITSAVAIYEPISGYVPFVTTQPRVGDIAANLTMFQQPLGVHDIDPVYWTLIVELRFYVLFALVAWRGLDRRKAILFCIGWMTAAVLTPEAHLPLLDLIVMPEYAPYFIAGLAMYLIYRFGGSPLLFSIVGFAYLVCLHLATLRVLANHPGWPLRIWPGLLLVTIAFALMLAVALGFTDRIQWKWLSIAGALTYPFYLLHQRIGYTAIRKIWLHTHWPPMAIIPGVVVAMLSLAWLVHRLIERPFGRILRSVLKREIAGLQRPAPTVPVSTPPVQLTPAHVRLNARTAHAYRRTARTIAKIPANPPATADRS